MSLSDLMSGMKLSTWPIMALILFSGTQSGAFDQLPAALAFLRTPEFRIAFWMYRNCHSLFIIHPYFFINRC